MPQRLNLTSEATNIVDTIVSWGAPKLLERPTLIEINGKAAPQMTLEFPQTQAEGHRLIIRMDVKAARQLSDQIRDLINRAGLS